MVLDMTSSNLEPVYDIAKYREGDPTILEMEPALAEHILRWRPKVPLRAGLAKTIEHFRAEMVVAKQMAADHLYSQY
jgi:nucleoside-diphosphate-sugar epimerase